MDRYEASVWQLATNDPALVKRLQAGRATAAELAAAGAVQVSIGSHTHDCVGPPFPSSFPASGSWTSPLYAASLPGVVPTACVTALQAEQACALVGKRLLTNDEWQRAAAGTPDELPMDENSPLCNIVGASGPLPTGSRTACVSRWGVYDMVGNLNEWVGDWTDRATGCSSWASPFGGDLSCFAGPGSGLPGAIYRGGYWGLTGSYNAGVFSATSIDPPSFPAAGIGFRCAR